MAMFQNTTDYFGECYFSDFKEILSSLSIGGEDSHGEDSHGGDEEGHDSHGHSSHARRKKRHLVGSAGNVRITRDTHGMNSGNISQVSKGSETYKE